MLTWTSDVGLFLKSTHCIEVQVTPEVHVGMGILTVLCVEPWLLHVSILKVSGWKHVMGAMAKRLETCHGSHGKKATMAKSRLGQMSWRP